MNPQSDSQYDVSYRTIGADDSWLRWPVSRRCPQLVDDFREAMEQGKEFEIEQRNRSASGDYRWFLNVGVPYHDSKTGQITKWVGISVDIHDRLRDQQALQESEACLRQLSAQLVQQVQERTKELLLINQALKVITEELIESNTLLYCSNESLQQFASVASHDLQEPLRKIQQFGGILKRRYPDSIKEDKVYLERMQSADARMSMLIGDLLEYARLSTQRDGHSPVSHQTVVESVLTTLELRS